jgi:hypothetical protein
LCIFGANDTVIPQNNTGILSISTYNQITGAIWQSTLEIHLEFWNSGEQVLDQQTLAGEYHT